MNWTTEGVYLTFWEGVLFKKGDLFKRVVMSRVYGLQRTRYLDQQDQIHLVQRCEQVKNLKNRLFQCNFILFYPEKNKNFQTRHMHIRPNVCRTWLNFMVFWITILKILQHNYSKRFQTFSNGHSSVELH